MLNSSMGYPRLGMGNSVSSHTNDAMNGTALAGTRITNKRGFKERETYPR
jgi:hypothetical protein